MRCTGAPRRWGRQRQSTRRELSSPPTKCNTSTDRSISLRGTWLSSFSITCHVHSSGPASAWIACADKVHRVNSQVTAGLRRPVRTHAACISTLIALRPSLGSVRCCDHSCKITFLALGRRLTSGRADDRWTRCSELLVSSRKRSTWQPELSQAGPSDSQRGGRARAHSRQLPVALGLSVQASGADQLHATFGRCLFPNPIFIRTHARTQIALWREGVLRAAVLLVRLAPPVPRFHPGTRGGLKQVEHARR